MQTIDKDFIALKKIRAILTDLDGTLLEEDKSISGEMEGIVRRLEEEGIVFSFITGRPKYATERFAKQLKLQAPVVSCNGAILFHGAQTICRHSFTMARLRPLLEKADKLGITVLFYSKDVEYAMSPTQWVKKRILIGRNYPIHYPDEEEWQNLPVEKVNLMANEKSEAFMTLLAEVRELEEEFSIALYGSDGCEIVAAGVNKYRGLSEFSRYLEIPVEEIMVIGDNNNDIEMLTHAGIGAAVANASKAAMEAADYVCGNERTKGVIEAVRRFVLGEE